MIDEVNDDLQSRLELATGLLDTTCLISYYAIIFYQNSHSSHHCLF